MTPTAPGEAGSGAAPGTGSEADLRARLRDLQAARDEAPPHSAQGWRADLDAQIESLRRHLANLHDDG